MTETPGLDRIRAGRRLLLSSQPFFGVLSLRMQPTARPGTIPTMSTDGTRLYYDPATTETLDTKTLETTIARRVLQYS